MVAGLNLKVRFIRLIDATDDVGGATPTGTVLYDWIDGRIAPLSFNGMNPTIVIGQQGLETKRPLSGMFWPGTLAIQEEDIVEVIGPPNHRYFGKRFRVTTLEYDGNHPDQKRDHLLCTLTRSDISHGESYQ